MRDIKENVKVLGILIRTHRMEQGYSLRDLGEITRISHTLISNIEKGKQIPSPQTLKDIFKVLHLEFHDNENIVNLFRDNETTIYEHLFHYDYESAKDVMVELEKDEDTYLLSPVVVNYDILKCFFYAITQTPGSNIEEIITKYTKMTDFFSETQKQMFYFIQGLVHLNHERYNRATESFNLALTLGNKEIDVFIRQYNIQSYVRQYKFIDAFKLSEVVIQELERRTIYTRSMQTKLQIARIYYHIAKNDEVTEIVRYVQRFAEKYDIEELIEECIMLLAAIEIRNKNYVKAKELLSKMPDQESISTVLLRFKIAFTQYDTESIEEYFEQIKEFKSVTSHEKVWSYLQVQAMSRSEKLYEKETYLKLIERLVEISTTNNDQEMIGLSYQYLIMYYHEERSYKKALEVSDSLLHFKKIRIERK